MRSLKLFGGSKEAALARPACLDEFREADILDESALYLLR